MNFGLFGFPNPGTRGVRVVQLRNGQVYKLSFEDEVGGEEVIWCIGGSCFQFGGYIEFG